MKKRFGFYMTTLMIVILFSSCALSRKADPIILPAAGDVASISVVSGDVTAVSDDEQWIAEFMALLADMKSTSRWSINDGPTVKEYIMINLNCCDGTIKTVFFYEEYGKEYVEQPYQGIYRPASELGAKITELLDNGKLSVRTTVPASISRISTYK